MKRTTDDDVVNDAFCCAPYRDHLRRVGFTSYAQILNQLEHGRVKTYLELYEKLDPLKRCELEDLVLHIGDAPNPNNGGWTTWSAVSNAIPTIRRSSGMFVAPARNRHLTLPELFSGMGFPATNELSVVARGSEI